MARICMIGAGNVATHLSLALQRSGHEIIQVFSRTEETAKILAEKLNCPYTNNIQEILQAQLSIIAINDDAINAISSKLRGPVVHTSGTKSLEVLQNKASGVFYPLQTFSKNKNIDFRTIPICIEANNKKIMSLLQSLANSISDHVYPISSEQRKYLHLSAVIACNFSNLMYQFASEICGTHNISFEMLKPLINETSDKINHVSAAKAQTGPAHRKDLETIKEQLLLLEIDKEKKEIYKLLTQSIINRS